MASTDPVSPKSEPVSPHGLPPSQALCLPLEAIQLAHLRFASSSSKPFKFFLYDDSITVTIGTETGCQDGLALRRASIKTLFLSDRTDRDHPPQALLDVESSALAAEEAQHTRWSGVIKEVLHSTSSDASRFILLTFSSVPLSDPSPSSSADADAEVDPPSYHSALRDIWNRLDDWSISKTPYATSANLQEIIGPPDENRRASVDGTDLVVGVGRARGGQDVERRPEWDAEAAQTAELGERGTGGLGDDSVIRIKSEEPADGPSLPPLGPRTVSPASHGDIKSDHRHPIDVIASGRSRASSSLDDPHAVPGRLFGSLPPHQIGAHDASHPVSTEDPARALPLTAALPVAGSHESTPFRTSPLMPAHPLPASPQPPALLPTPPSDSSELPSVDPATRFRASSINSSLALSRMPGYTPGPEPVPGQLSVPSDESSSLIVEPPKDPLAGLGGGTSKWVRPTAKERVEQGLALSQPRRPGIATSSHSATSDSQPAERAPVQADPVNTALQSLLVTGYRDPAPQESGLSEPEPTSRPDTSDVSDASTVRPAPRKAKTGHREATPSTSRTFFASGRLFHAALLSRSAGPKTVRNPNRSDSDLLTDESGRDAETGGEEGYATGTSGIVQGTKQTRLEVDEDGFAKPMVPPRRRSDLARPARGESPDSDSIHFEGVVLGPDGPEENDEGRDETPEISNRFTTTRNFQRGYTGLFGPDRDRYRENTVDSMMSSSSAATYATLPSMLRGGIKGNRPQKGDEDAKSKKKRPPLADPLELAREKKRQRQIEALFPEDRRRKGKAPRRVGGPDETTDVQTTESEVDPPDDAPSLTRHTSNSIIPKRRLLRRQDLVGLSPAEATQRVREAQADYRPIDRSWLPGLSLPPLRVVGDEEVEGFLEEVQVDEGMAMSRRERERKEREWSIGDLHAKIYTKIPIDAQWSIEVLEKDWNAIQQIAPTVPDLVSVGGCKTEPLFRRLLTNQPRRDEDRLPVLIDRDDEAMEVDGDEDEPATGFLETYERRAAEWWLGKEVTSKQVRELKKRTGWEGQAGVYIQELARIAWAREQLRKYALSDAVASGLAALKWKARAAEIMSEDTSWGDPSGEVYALTKELVDQLRDRRPAVRRTSFLV